MINSFQIDLFLLFGGYFCVFPLTSSSVVLFFNTADETLAQHYPLPQLVSTSQQPHTGGSSAY